MNCSNTKWSEQSFFYKLITLEDLEYKDIHEDTNIILNVWVRMILQWEWEACLYIVTTYL